MNKDTKNIVCVLLVTIALMVGFGIFRWIIEPMTRAVENTHDYVVQKVDDATRYETKKKVEDSCRASIASYETDKATYDLYKDSADEEEQGWAKQARMRANKTASIYNSYILTNDFVWAGNIPKDIQSELELITE